MIRRNLALGVVAVVLIGGCASHDRQDRFVLGAATKSNIATHAVRDPELPNHKDVGGQSAERGVAAVRDAQDSIVARGEGTGG